GSVAAPDWNRAWLATSISYHRSSDPPPPKTACEVHSAVAPPCAGSTAATACVRRPSSVSIVCALPICGAGDGGEYCATGTAVPDLGMFAVPSGFFVTSYSSSSVPVAPEFVLSGTATTQPVEDASACTPGSGVEARVTPSAFWMAVCWPCWNVLAAGHVV